jgi:hypothetical protein
MTCLAPTSNNEMFHNENKFFPMNERFNGWASRKHCIEDFSSDEEAHTSMQDKQSLDRLKVSRAFYIFPNFFLFSEFSFVYDIFFTHFVFFSVQDIDFHDLSMRATLLNAEYRYAQDESST